MRFILSTASVAFATALLAGCGSGTGSNNDGTPPAAAALSVVAASTPVRSQINMGDAIANAHTTPEPATPWTLFEQHMDTANMDGSVPDPTANYCDDSVNPPMRNSFNSVSGQTDPLADLSPAYFPFVFVNGQASTANGIPGDATTPLIGLFDWRPKDTNEAVIAAQSNDNGKTWSFMQTVLEYNTGASSCPANAQSTLADSTGDTGYGHPTVIQLPTGASYLYTLDRSTGNVDLAGLNATTINVTPKYPLWNIGKDGTDIETIQTANKPVDPLDQSTFSTAKTTGLKNPDGILAVVPNTDPKAPTKVLYIQKILGADNVGQTAIPIAEQCTAAPTSGKINHDIVNVRLAETTDGINFTDLGVVQGLNDPTTVDYNQTRYIAPRGTLIDVNGDGSRWGLIFAGGNCLDGDSDAFHYIGYAESSDLMHWTVYNDINSPILSIKSITTTNQADGSTVTIPKNTPLAPTQPWFNGRVYAPTATMIDGTHLSLTFAGYTTQKPKDDLYDYRQIGNLVLTTGKTLTVAPKNANEQ